jgi:hypothetical protein
MIPRIGPEIPVWGAEYDANGHGTPASDRYRLERDADYGVRLCWLGPWVDGGVFSLMTLVGWQDMVKRQDHKLIPPPEIVYVLPNGDVETGPAYRRAPTALEIDFAASLGFYDAIGTIPGGREGKA